MNNHIAYRLKGFEAVLRGTIYSAHFVDDGSAVILTYKDGK